MTTNYFDVAARIIRQHEHDRVTKVCRCNAYAFPHRAWSGSCTGYHPEFGVGRDAEFAKQNAEFNRTEIESGVFKNA